MNQVLDLDGPEVLTGLRGGGSLVEMSRARCFSHTERPEQFREGAHEFLTTLRR